MACMHGQAANTDIWIEQEGRGGHLKKRRTKEIRERKKKRGRKGCVSELFEREKKKRAKRKSVEKIAQCGRLRSSLRVFHHTTHKHAEHTGTLQARRISSQCCGSDEEVERHR